MVKKFTPSIGKGSTPLPADFPSPLVVRVVGVPPDSQLHEQIIKQLDSAINPFVASQRQMQGFSKNQFHKKLAVVGDYGLAYTSNGEQETLLIVPKPKPPTKPKKQKNEEEYKLKVCMVFYGTNQVAAFPMKAMEGTTWPPALAKRTLTESNWATSDGLNYDVVDGQNWFRPSWTLQMKNSVEIGNVAVHRLKFEDNVVTLDEEFFQITLLDFGFERSVASNISSNGFALIVPTIHAYEDGVIVGDVLYDRNLDITNGSCFNLGSLSSYFEYPGSPGATGTFIDRDRKVWNPSGAVDYDFSGDEPAIGSATIGVNPKGVQTTTDLELAAPYEGFIFGFTAEFNAAPAGLYNNLKFWLPVLEQVEGLDKIRAVECTATFDTADPSNVTVSMSGEGSYSNSGDNYAGFTTRAFPYSFPGERPVIEETEYTGFYTKRSFVLPDGTTIAPPAEVEEGSASRADCRHQVSNGLARFHTLTLYRSDYVERVDKAFLNGVDCTSSMELQLGVGIDQVHTVFFDVPYEALWKLK